MNTVLKISIVLSALSTAIALSAPASAARIGDLDHSGPSSTVKYSDLDTSKTADMRELYARITSAAKHVCTSAQDAGLGREGFDVNSQLMNFQSHCKPFLL